MQRQSPSGGGGEDPGLTITEDATLAVIDDVQGYVLTVVDMLVVVDMPVATMADEDTQ